MLLNDTINLNGLKQDIYFAAKINANTFNQSDLLRIINKYYKAAQSVVRGINEDFYGEIWSFDWMTNTGGTYPNEYVMVSTSYEKIKQIQCAPAPANIASPQYPSEFQVANLITQNQITDPTYTFSTPTATIYDASFFMYPTPTQTITGGLRVFTIELQADLASDADKPNLFPDYHDVITWGSCIDIATRLGRDKLLKQATTMYVQRTNALKEYTSQRTLALSGGIVEGQGAEGGWDFPFGKLPMS